MPRLRTRSSLSTTPPPVANRAHREFAATAGRPACAPGTRPAGRAGARATCQPTGTPAAGQAEHQEIVATAVGRETPAPGLAGLAAVPEHSTRISLGHSSSSGDRSHRSYRRYPRARPWQYAPAGDGAIRQPPTATNLHDMGIEYESVVDHPLDEVFAWHTRPGRDAAAGAAVAADDGGCRDGLAGRRPRGAGPARRVALGGAARPLGVRSRRTGSSTCCRRTGRAVVAAAGHRTVAAHPRVQ